jgi:predicted phosphodiesterase
MRFAILSDVHANLEALNATLQGISREAVDRIVCLGDIVGYNANPVECLALLREAGALCVAGNHERATTGQLPPATIPRALARSVQWTRRQLDSEMLDFLAQLPSELYVPPSLVAVHGALHSPQQRETLYLNSEERRRLSFEALAIHASGARFCGFGHTHLRGIFAYRDGRELAYEEDEIALQADTFYLFNPGSVGQPRTAERRATFMVLDMARYTIAVRRVDYDAEAAFAKARRAGLLPSSVTGFGPIDTILRGLRRAGIRWR